MAKLKRSYGKAQENTWQSSIRLMAKLKKSYGKAQENTWQSSIRLMAKLNKTHGKGQEDSWQSSKFTTTQVKWPITRTPTPQE